MIDAIVTDLEFARTTGVAVEITTFTGEKIFTGVHSVDEDGQFVRLHDPKAMGDETTLRKVTLEDITSITVTDITY